MGEKFATQASLVTAALELFEALRELWTRRDG